MLLAIIFYLYHFIGSRVTTADRGKTHKWAITRNVGHVQLSKGNENGNSQVIFWMAKILCARKNNVICHRLNPLSFECWGLFDEFPNWTLPSLFSVQVIYSVRKNYWCWMEDSSHTLPSNSVRILENEVNNQLVFTNDTMCYITSKFISSCKLERSMCDQLTIRNLISQSCWSGSSVQYYEGVKIDYW